MRTFLLILAIAHTAMGQTIKCPGPYHAVGTGCYTFPERDPASWIEASTLCQFTGGYLAVIDSEAEQMALETYHHANYPDTRDRWIAATDMLSNGIWRWVPSGAAVVYNYWAQGQPAPSSTKHCAYWTPLLNYWSTIECCLPYEGLKPLCEVDPL